MPERKILGAVIQSGRIFKAGDEDALAAAMQGRSMQHLIDNNTIEGDWTGANKKSAATSDREGDGAFKTTATTVEEKDTAATRKAADRTATKHAEEEATTKKKSARKSSKKKK